MASAYATNFTVAVNGTPSHPIPSTLFGLMYEDISHSGDGGLYAEMLQNRAFQLVTPGTTDALEAWTPVNGGAISVVNNTPSVSEALPNSLQLDVPSGSTGQVGVQNSGYFGINVNASWAYNASFFYKASSFTGTFTVSLLSSSGETLASSTVNATGDNDSWTQLATTLKPTQGASDTNNTFAVTVDGAEGSNQTIFFALFSLFPPTFKDRPNGMRVDLSETLRAMSPAFFRFPGGNNLEGQTFGQRWQWNKTIGPLTDRPGRQGDWGYINTDGLGIMEYLNWIEDMEMEPIMAVWSGYSLDQQSIPEGGLGPYIQQAKDQIDFVIGDPSTNEQAAKRAALGHPEPYKLRFVEIGNEDFFASDTYLYRWRDIAGNLTAEYPNITFLATSDTSGPVLSPTPQSYDVHVYQTPTWFAQNAFIYDSFERNGTIYFEGEYAAISTNSSDVFGTPADGRLVFPTMESSAGEAAFMTGLERNADIVFAASYAPLIGSVQDNQWTPNLLAHTPDTVIKSTSYYVQKLFSLNKGDEYLPSTLPVSDGTGKTFWSITRRNTTQEVLIKISNTDTSPATLTFNFPFALALTGTATTLTGDPTTSNTPDAPDAITPTSSEVNTSNDTLVFTAGAVSVNFIAVGLQ